MEQQAARAAARRLYQRVNFTGRALQFYELSSLLNETYEYLHIPFKPNSKDIKSYADVLDANKDGKVTVEDLEQVAVQYLCGPGVLSPASIDSNYKSKKFQTSIVSSATYQTSLVRPSSSNHQITKQQRSVNNKQEQRSMEQSNLQYIPQRQYNSATMNILAITRDIFKSHADMHFTITEKEVPQVLTETYETLGRKGYRPSNEDVAVWMKLCDGNGDGHVQYADYEYFVARSLERSGFQIYQ